LMHSYRDPSAPPPDAPLAVEWASLSGSLYVHSAHSGDLKPGLLHDRWFLGALSIVASRQVRGGPHTEREGDGGAARGGVVVTPCRRLTSGWAAASGHRRGSERRCAKC
jgi:hypothetical protein